MEVRVMRNQQNTRVPVVAGICVTGLLTLFAACSGQTRSASVAPAIASGLERGKYLVTSVGECSDCHTPRLKDGRFDETRLLQGSVLGFAPTVPMPVWAPKSPSIAGGPEGWTRDELVAFLETGKNPQGQFARPPMPSYRLSGEDARAVADYLLSLGGRDRK